jgi:hypothetical protein
MLVSITELHNLTGLDRRRITKALADLDHKSGDKGAKQYPSDMALPLLYLTPEDAALDPNKERARLTHHQANIAALDEREKSGELVRRVDVVAEVSEAIANCRARLLTIPTKLSTVVIGMDDVQAVRGALQAGVHEALDELHNTYVSDEPSGEDVEESPDADGERVG